MKCRIALLLFLLSGASALNHRNFGTKSPVKLPDRLERVIAAVRAALLLPEAKVEIK